MEFKQYEERCKKEFKAKKRGRWVLSKIIPAVGTAYLILSWICNLSYGVYHPGILTIVIYFVLSAIGVSLSTDKETKNAIEQYEISEAHRNLPEDYPYSIVYPGETWPFGRTDIQPQNAPLNNCYVAPAPKFVPAVASAPAYAYATAPAAVSAQPQQVRLFCEHCGQQMFIPANRGSFRITCQKCGNHTIHTN